MWGVFLVYILFNWLIWFVEVLRVECRVHECYTGSLLVGYTHNPRTFTEEVIRSLVEFVLSVDLFVCLCVCCVCFKNKKKPMGLER